MSKVKVVFSDIDGTLLRSDHTVSPRTANSIAQAIAKGIDFVPVSARMPEAIRPITDSMDLRTPVIAYNGGLILDNADNVLHSITMPWQVAQAVCRYTQDHSPEVYWNAYSYKNWLSQGRGFYWIAREEEIVGLQSTEAQLDDFETYQAFHKILVMGEPEGLTQFQEKLKQAFPELSIVKSLPHLLEVMATGVEKGLAVKTYQEIVGVNREETIAFGDNYNDLAMFDQVGTAYVMGNAPEEIQKRYGHVTADHDHDGIAEVLDRLMEGIE